MKLGQVELATPKIPVSFNPWRVIEVPLEEPSAVMKLIAAPKAPWKCYIRHADGRCDCTPPEVKDISKLGALEDAFMYTAGVLRKKGDPRKLSDEDLILLAYSTSKMLGHWGRLILGQSDLR